MILSKYFHHLRSINCSKFSILKQRCYPYKFGGADYDFNCNENNELKISQNIFRLQDITQQFKQTYIEFITALQQKDTNILKQILDKKLLDSIEAKNVKLINYGEQIQSKYMESKIIIGIDRDRDQHQQKMMKITVFPQINLGIFLAATKTFNTSFIPMLFQTKIAYKSAMKLINMEDKGQENSNEQIHIVQYQTLGKFNPLQTDIQAQIKVYKDSIGIFNMHKSKQILGEQLMKWINLDKNDQTWKITDFDQYLQGNHPKF